jgi:hypothetical protein
VDIPTIQVLDNLLGDLLAEVHLSDTVTANGIEDVQLKQTIHVELSENVEAVTVLELNVRHSRTD